MILSFQANFSFWASSSSILDGFLIEVVEEKSIMKSSFCGLKSLRFSTQAISDTMSEITLLTAAAAVMSVCKA